jgi:hypothetical protein
MGILVISLGGYAFGIQDQLPVFQNALPVTLIVLGGFVMLVSLIGCVGAAKESGNTLKAYFGILVIIVLIEAAIGVAALANSGRVRVLSVTGASC